MAIANTPPLYATRHDCGAKMVITTDAIGRPRKRCPVCTGVARSATTLAPEHVGRSQARNAPPVPPLTLPKNRPAIGILPSFNAFVEVPVRPAPLPSRYVKTEAETHPKDLPADHPRRIQYLERIKETKRRNQKARRAAQRAKQREARQ